jgi:hypothetical protein
MTASAAELLGWDDIARWPAGCAAPTTTWPI